jgi:hypothetical protein
VTVNCLVAPEPGAQRCVYIATEIAPAPAITACVCTCLAAAHGAARVAEFRANKWLSRHIEVWCRRRGCARNMCADVASSLFVGRAVFRVCNTAVLLLRMMGQLHLPARACLTKANWWLYLKGILHEGTAAGRSAQMCAAQSTTQQLVLRSASRQVLG